MSEVALTVLGGHAYIGKREARVPLFIARCDHPDFAQLVRQGVRPLFDETHLWLVTPEGVRVVLHEEHPWLCPRHELMKGEWGFILEYEVEDELWNRAFLMQGDEVVDEYAPEESWMLLTNSIEG